MTEDITIKFESQTLGDYYKFRNWNLPPNKENSANDPGLLLTYSNGDFDWVSEAKAISAGIIIK